MLITSLSRRMYELELLEPRRLLTIVPVDVQVAVPFEGLIATDLQLPANATGLDWINVRIGDQWDYQPTAVAKPDGTFDLYTSMTIQRSGTNDVSIIYRNNDTGGWDDLAFGQATVRPNDFDATWTSSYYNALVPGTRFRDPLATFEASSLAEPLDKYSVQVNWFGQTKVGHLVDQGNGTVAAYLDDAYLPMNGHFGVSVTIRRADGSPAGYSTAEIYAYQDIGIGMFYGSTAADKSFAIDLPSGSSDPYSYFAPAAEIEGWPSTFSVEMIWQYHDTDIATTSGTLVRNDDGSYKVVGQVPADLTFDNGQIKITETIQRPALDGQPAETYDVLYVGSFDISGAPIDPVIPEEPPIDLPPSDGEVEVIDLPVDGQVISIDMTPFAVEGAQTDALAPATQENRDASPPPAAAAKATNSAHESSALVEDVLGSSADGADRDAIAPA